MSLNRVKSIEGLQRDTDADSVTVSYRRMSFNPVDEWVPETQKGMEEPEAFSTSFTEVSKQKRVVQCGVAVLYCLLSAGVVFGMLRYWLVQCGQADGDRVRGYQTGTDQ